MAKSLPLKASLACLRLRSGLRHSRRLSTNIDEIIDKNHAWSIKNKEWFETHGRKPHKPQYLWIACSDARVSPNLMLDTQPGQVLVHRNIANLVVNTDMSLMSVLHYAVSVLHVPHVIVCGHYDSGGVRASMARSSLGSRDLAPPLENWLGHIRDVHRLHHEELDALQDGEARHRRLVELNVMEQCTNLYKTGTVQRRMIEHRKSGAVPPLQIHGLVYDPHTGRLSKVPLTDKTVHEVDTVYQLFEH